MNKKHLFLVFALISILLVQNVLSDESGKEGPPIAPPAPTPETRIADATSGTPTQSLSCPAEMAVYPSSGPVANLQLPKGCTISADIDGFKADRVHSLVLRNGLILSNCKNVRVRGNVAVAGSCAFAFVNDAHLNNVQGLKYDENTLSFDFADQLTLNNHDLWGTMESLRNGRVSFDGGYALNVSGVFSQQKTFAFMNPLFQDKNVYVTRNLTDSDSDGLSDGDEVLVYGTDPLIVNSDGRFI